MSTFAYAPAKTSMQSKDAPKPSEMQGQYLVEKAVSHNSQSTLFSFARIGIQPKMKINQPEDEYEQEADRVAEQVTRLSSPSDSAAHVATTKKEGIDRKCSACETEEEEEVKISRKAASPATNELSEKAEHMIDGLNAGLPLDSSSKEFMESRFGFDFSRVRVHTDRQAAASARTISARAYTFKSEIVFDSGQYTPDTIEGRKLLAHELTHVIQQVPHIARKEGEEKVCLTGKISGKREGQGSLLTFKGQRVYSIWGSWQEGDDYQSYNARIFPLWIRWRFGTVPAATRTLMLDTLNSLPEEIFEHSPTPGCQYFTLLPMDVLRVLTIMARPESASWFERGGEEANRREEAAGLAPMESAATSVVASVQSGTVSGAAARRAENIELPVPRLGSEYEGGTDTRRANAPALPARISGPDRQTVHGIGTYRMELEYWPAGSDLLSQVVEAMNWVNYHWEVYDITAPVRQGLRESAIEERRHAAVSEEAEIGPMSAAGRRAEHAAEELAADVERATQDLMNPVARAHGGTPLDVVTRAIANYESLQLLPASAIVSLGGVSLGALADLLGGTFQEREIPWPSNVGFFMIRCIAAPTPQGPNGEIRRAASVATKVVEVQKPEQLAASALDEPEAEIAELELLIALESDPARRLELESRLADLRVAATGDTITLLQRAIVRKTTERDAATGYRRRELERELEAMNRRLELARAQRGRMIGRIYRLRAAFTSQVTAETYPLLLQLGMLEHDGERYRYRISDVTTPDSKSYDGGGATASEAVWNAVREMASHNEYGLGRLAIRMPEGAPFEPREKILESAPRDVALVRKRLNDLVAVLTMLGLFVPGVGGVAAVIGAALAVERLITRWDQHTLRFDAAAIGDLIAVLGAAGQGAALIGRMRVVRTTDRFILARETADEAALRTAAGALSSARIAERIVAIGNEIVNYGGLMYGNLLIIMDIMEINQRELEGHISHAEARRQRASLIMSALKDNTIEFLQAAALPEGAIQRPRKPHAVETPTVPEMPPPHVEGEAAPVHERPPAEEEAGPSVRTTETEPHIKPEIARPAKDVETAILRLEPMTDETRVMLRNDPDLALRLAAHPRAARAIKKCRSSCFSRATEGQLVKIDSLLERYKREYGEAATDVAEKYLREHRDSLDAAIRDLEIKADLAQEYAEWDKPRNREPELHPDDPIYRARADAVEEIRPQGRIAEEHLNYDLQQQYRNVDREVQIVPNKPDGQPADFWFRADFVVSNAPGSYRVLDAKATKGAPLTANQIIGYAMLKRYGGTIRSKQKSIPQGTRLPVGTATQRAVPMWDVMSQSAPLTNRFTFNDI